MRNKKTIMTFSALFILIFHLWISVTNSQMESYLRQLCVIGVDLFFFISAYSISNRDTAGYKEFIVDRFNKVYLKYIIFAIIGMLYLSWSLKKFIRVILGMELFIKGGGAFLWFIPGIMLVYLLLPLYKKLDNKLPKIIPFIIMILFFVISILVSLCTTYNAIFILTNRLPIILLGYYFAKYDVINRLHDNNVAYWGITFFALIFGFVISYLVYINHFSVSWFKDIFYILYIPLNIGLILLLDRIKVNKIFNLIGTITLELYGVQMIFGFKLANSVLRYINNNLLSNMITIVLLIVISTIIHYIFNLKDKFRLSLNK